MRQQGFVPARPHACLNGCSLSDRLHLSMMLSSVMVMLLAGAVESSCLKAQHTTSQIKSSVQPHISNRAMSLVPLSLTNMRQV